MTKERRILGWGPVYEAPPRARPGHIYVSRTAPLLRWIALSDGRLYDISTGGKNIIPYDPALHEETIA